MGPPRAQQQQRIQISLVNKNGEHALDKNGLRVLFSLSYLCGNVSFVPG